MNSFISPASFWLPHRPSINSGWAEHAPFAFWLIGALKPKMLVELGTHTGYSFSAFCQAVDEYRLTTNCYAVDTWRGDEHAGFYGDEVFDELSFYIKNRYGRFASLIRSTFDEALQGFEDGSVDLLHIDGRHFYEDVKADYSSWKIKLSPNAVVLFHDINVRDRDFGVYKLWEQLRAEHSSFEFEHGNGLGVLGLGDQSKGPLKQLFDLSNAERIELQKLYCYLGRAVSNYFDIGARIHAIQRFEQELQSAGEYARRLEADIKSRTENEKEATSYVRSLEAKLNASSADEPALPDVPAFTPTVPSKAELTAEASFAGPSSADQSIVASPPSEELIRSLKTRIDRLQFGIASRDHAIAEGARAVQRARSEQRRLIDAVSLKSAEFENLILEFQRLRSQNAELLAGQQRGAAYHDNVNLSIIAESEHLRAQLLVVRQQLNDVLGSTSWKATALVRRVLANSVVSRRMVRRLLKLVWWTITLQLRARIVARYKATLPSKVPAELASPVPHARETSSVSPAYPAEGMPVSHPGGGQEYPLLNSKILNEKEIFTEVAAAELHSFLASGERISFPTVHAPDISVVIVVWNQAHLTLRCLRALSAQVGPSFEIVVIDNASSDHTERLLAQFDGIVVISNETNEGFLLGCNRGVTAARGDSVLLLNSDAFVQPGALSAAFAALGANVGAVGGRLVLPSGSLQEAGSIVWADGSTLGYGRGLSPTASDAMFRRNVDYCSGAFLLTPRELWNRLKGFDVAFAPAYYEEADYCMRVWELGLRVVYEPGAVVDHYEFGSEAKRGDMLASSLKNRKLFRERHSEALLKNHLPPGVGNILGARTRLTSERGRLLVIDNEIPIGSLGSGYPRANAILKEAEALGWFVTFFPIHQVHVNWEQARAEVPSEIEIVAEHAHPRLLEFLQNRSGYYNAIIVSRPDNMAIFKNIVQSQPEVLHGTRVIYDAEAVFSMRDAAKARLDGTPFSEAELNRRLDAEIGLAQGADRIICVSEEEANLFSTRQGSPVHVLSHPSDSLIDAPSFDSRSGFLFVGRLLEKEAPNWDGLAWFIANCWPIIRAQLPDAALNVIGHLHDEHDELKAPGVRLLGPVADLKPFYDAGRVFIAPIRFAAGVPIKILEATAAGLPTLGTRLMARQLGWRSGVEIAADDTFGLLSSAAISLHEDRCAWEAMRAAAQSRLVADHSKQVFRERLQQILGLAPA